MPRQTKIHQLIEARSKQTNMMQIIIFIQRTHTQHTHTDMR